MSSIERYLDRSTTIDFNDIGWGDETPPVGSWKRKAKPIPFDDIDITPWGGMKKPANPWKDITRPWEEKDEVGGKYIKPEPQDPKSPEWFEWYNNQPKISFDTSCAMDRAYQDWLAKGNKGTFSIMLVCRCPKCTARNRTL